MKELLFFLCMYLSKRNKKPLGYPVGWLQMALALLGTCFSVPFVCDQNGNLNPKYRRNFVILRFCKNFVRLSIEIEGPVFRAVFLEY